MTMLNFLRTSAVILCFAAAPLVGAQTDKPVPGELKVKPGKETQTTSDTATAGTKEGKDRDKDKAKDDDKEPPPSVTEHTLNVGGKAIRYRATTGYMVMRDWAEKKKPEDGDGPRQGAPAAAKEADKPKDKDDKDKDKDQPKQKAKVFYVAYQRIDVGDDPSKRPITFSFNGGPGSASVWLHLGALGPRRTELTERGEAPLAPYRLVDNEATWLDATDLVFIDPVSTGFSRSAPGEDAKQFHGYKEDLASVGDFIRLYTSRNTRWASPKFIIGESYGTTRAAGLSDYLQERYGFYVNGIILVSSILDFSTARFAPGNDRPYSLFLPTYTAAAWYHKKLPQDLQSKPLADVLRESESFASNEYLLALDRGDQLNDNQRQELAASLARLTGLPAEMIAQSNFRIPARRFFFDLLKDKNRSIGRYDARFTGIRYEPGTEEYDFDPSYEAVLGPYSAMMNDYLRRELKFESDLPYEMIADVRPWNYANVAQNQYLNVAEDLRKAMSRNPYLKLWVCCGYYDLATPYYAAEHTLHGMLLDPSIRDNLRMTFYEAGHMIYINHPSLLQFRNDAGAFIQDALKPRVVPAAEP
ncbi:MAG: peptidase S10 [Verrucomicrobiota bacterium]|nr:peptidase S10 [Verrucomicrobiota bacterium]